MKASLCVAALLLLAAAPAGAQMIGGATLAPPQFFPILPWTPPANLPAVEVSGTDGLYVPSTFLTFDRAIAAGQADLKEQAKTVAEAAAESRKAKYTAKIRLVQDDRGRAIISKD